jgi:hypothetical protein
MLIFTCCKSKQGQFFTNSKISIYQGSLNTDLKNETLDFKLTPTVGILLNKDSLIQSSTIIKKDSKKSIQSKLSKSFSYSFGNKPFIKKNQLQLKSKTEDSFLEGNFRLLAIICSLLVSLLIFLGIKWMIKLKFIYAFLVGIPVVFLSLFLVLLIMLIYNNGYMGC